MRPARSPQVIFRNIITEVIQEKERIEVGRSAEAECTPQVHPRAFECRLGLNEPTNRSNGYDRLQE